MKQRTLTVKEIREYNTNDREIERCLLAIAERIEKGEKILLKEKIRANGSVYLCLYEYDKNFHRYEATEIFDLVYY